MFERGGEWGWCPYRSKLFYNSCYKIIKNNQYGPYGTAETKHANKEEIKTKHKNLNPLDKVTPHYQIQTINPYCNGI